MKTDDLSVYIREHSLEIHDLKPLVKKGEAGQATQAYQRAQLRRANLAAACRNGTDFKKAQVGESNEPVPQSYVLGDWLQKAHPATPVKVCRELCAAWLEGKPAVMPWWSAAKTVGYLEKRGLPVPVELTQVVEMARTSFDPAAVAA